MRPDARPLLGAALAILLAGCAGGSGLQPFCEAPGAAEADIAQYRLGPEDQIRLTVFRHPDLSGRFALDGNGHVALPLVGDVDALGRTTRELEQVVARRLRDDGYLMDPKVSVDVLTYRSFYVLGEIARPGAYEYRSGITVTNAVALAGGFTYRANQDRIVVRRGDCLLPADATSPVLPGEVVMVPERFF